MKNILTLLASISILSNVHAATLVLHYDFSEGSGTTTADLSGNGQTGNFISGASFSSDVTGGQGPFSLSLDGTGTVETADSSFNSVTGELSLAAWVNPTSVTSSGNRGIISKYITSGNQRAYTLP